ncbi:hypothetical protein VP01_1104g1 [Puccinia sorghi]|uniref:Uncharacterized protein n=1 Tax=Puccinia sorghi TaxID=27349 RepID=A0A0L6VT05_9BASI|nr:hypothetical protein VP01_1104g1 [Puccinia sorghi]
MTKYHQRATGLINDSPRSLVSSPKTWMRFAEKPFEDDRSVSFYVFLMHPLGMDFPMKAGVGSLITWAEARKCIRRSPAAATILSAVSPSVSPQGSQRTCVAIFISCVHAIIPSPKAEVSYEEALAQRWSLIMFAQTFRVFLFVWRIASSLCHYPSHKICSQGPVTKNKTLLIIPYQKSKLYRYVGSYIRILNTMTIDVGNQNTWVFPNISFPFQSVSVCRLPRIMRTAIKDVRQAGISNNQGFICTPVATSKGSVIASCLQWPKWVSWDLPHLHFEYAPVSKIIEWHCLPVKIYLSQSDFPQGPIYAFITLSAFFCTGCRVDKSKDDEFGPVDFVSEVSIMEMCFRCQDLCQLKHHAKFHVKTCQVTCS